MCLSTTTLQSKSNRKSLQLATARPRPLPRNRPSPQVLEPDSWMLRRTGKCLFQDDPAELKRAANVSTDLQVEYSPPHRGGPTMPLSSLSSCLGLQAPWDSDLSSKLQPRGILDKSRPTLEVGTINTLGQHIIVQPSVCHSKISTGVLHNKHRQVFFIILTFSLSSALSTSILPSSVTLRKPDLVSPSVRYSRTPVDFSLN